MRLTCVTMTSPVLLLCVALTIQSASAGGFGNVYRQNGGEDDSPAPVTTGTTPETTAEGGTDQESITEPATFSETDATATDSPAETTETTASEPSITVTSTESPSQTTSLDSGLYNDTIPEGQLPLAPELTPGWGVAGVVMLVSGFVYTLIGIKNRYVHTFLSTAFLAALGITVLIVYVMTPPVSNAIQGGYVAAVVLSASILGVASVFFKELTECLGCALGGFCLSMWLLTLVPGGLLQGITPKAIFVACFTVVAFLFYFSRYTRDWALILLISFAGATASVLGIDCFSRAGLREFWAYIWELNKNLFPLGADTYPVTKGIRVETAAVIIIFLVGIVSQIKLWRIVREKKEKREAERAENQRNLAQEEEDVGRQIEETNARERRQWESAYGNGDVGSSTLNSELGDANAEKLRQSVHGSTKPESEVEVIEMADLSGSDRNPNTPDPLMAAEQDTAGKVTIRVAADDFPSARPSADIPAVAKRESNIDVERRSHVGSLEYKRQSRSQSVAGAPEVTPLPFAIPREDDSKSSGDRSSVATFADEEEESLAQSPRRRSSLAKRLSQSSSHLFRSLSPRSGFRSPDLTREYGESSEDLIVPNVRHHDDDEKSIAATFDHESVAAFDQLSAVEVERPLSPVAVQEHDEMQKLTAAAKQSAPVHDETDAKDDPSWTDTAAALRAKQSENAPTPSSHSRGGDAEPVSASQSEKPPKSVVSASSSRASLTKERLPASLSRVALSYRTNEWAKHLSQADAPELDQLQVLPLSQPIKSEPERPTPVDVGELQKASDEGTPPPAITRSESRASVGSVRSVSGKHNSSNPISTPMMADRDMSGFVPMPAPLHSGVVRSSSTTALRKSSSNFQPIAEEQDTPFSSLPIPEEQGSPVTFNDINRQRSPAPGVVSYNSPQTLIGQREMYLRSRSQGNLVAPTPDPGSSMSRAPSDAGSVISMPMYAASVVDPDDMPLSQRKNIMRQNSMMALQGAQPAIRRHSGLDRSESVTFDSHQPKRVSTLPTQAEREAQLAHFRSSVATELRSGTQLMTPSGRETPFASTTNLLAGRDAEIKRNIDLQRNMMLGQKDAHAHIREQQRQEKEWADRAFDERMRSGELMGAHREAMRRMQQNAKKS